MPKKDNDMIMEKEELELDDGVMQELLHDNHDSPSGSNTNRNDDYDEESNHDDTPHYIYNYIPSKQQLLQQKSLTTEHSKGVETIHKAASQLFHVIKKYGDTSSSSKWEDILTATDSPWKEDNIDTALDEIVAARNNMVEAWDKFHTDTDVDNSDNHQTIDNNDDDGHQPKMEWWEKILPSKKRLLNHQNDDTNNENWNQTNNTDNNNDVDEQQQQFHHVYMEYATNAFATELEALRRGTLEQQTSSTFKKKKKGAENNNDKHSTTQVGMELDLDPTQHSFVVASTSKRFGNNDNDEAAKAAAAAEIDVQVLSDMLSSGSHTLSAVEKHMLFKARQRGGSSSSVVVTESDGLSLHERRRLELGLGSGGR